MFFLKQPTVLYDSFAEYLQYIQSTKHAAVDVEQYCTIKQNWKAISFLSFASSFFWADVLTGVSLLVTQSKIAILLSEQWSTTKQKYGKGKTQLFNFMVLLPD